MSTHSLRVPLLGALLILLGAALVVSLLPAGLALDRRVAAEMRRAAIQDLARAPVILADRNATRAEALSMHAMSVATTEGLQEALSEGRIETAVALARETASMYGEHPVVIGPDGTSLAGPVLSSSLLESLRSGASPVEYIFEGGMPHAVAVADVGSGEQWLGAAGSAALIDESQTEALAGLTRADVTVVGADGSIVASTLDPGRAGGLVATLADLRWPPDREVIEASVDGSPTWIARGRLEEAGTVVFSRDVAEELATLPAVRRGAALAGFLTLVLALAGGSLLALTLTRPVGALALAADRVTEGDFEAPVAGSRVDEIDRLAVAFRSMRASLRSRLAELAEANRELEERQDRLSQLQAELIRQDRVASSARMAAELAHEIRNPVANVRNCLEVVRRHAPDDTESARFADMAIDELLRMHELAEHLIDLNRPADQAEQTCDAVDVAHQVSALARIGDGAGTIELVTETDRAECSIPPDALKQILFNLVDNAREASGDSAKIEIRVFGTPEGVAVEVLDRGPGIDPEILPHIFDPFFTTKDSVSGVGLGLSVAQGIARQHGARMEASNRQDGAGARFRLELRPAAGARKPVSDA